MDANVNAEEGRGLEGGFSLRFDSFLSDNICVPELRTRSEIRALRPRGPGHTVLGRVVRRPSHGQLRRDMSSDGPVAPMATARGGK